MPFINSMKRNEPCTLSDQELGMLLVQFTTTRCASFQKGLGEVQGHTGLFNATDVNIGDSLKRPSWRPPPLQVSPYQPLLSSSETLTNLQVPSQKPDGLDCQRSSPISKSQELGVLLLLLKVRENLSLKIILKTKIF